MSRSEADHTAPQMGNEAEERLAARMKVDVSSPTLAEEQAAYLHLVQRAEARASAYYSAQEMRTEESLHRSSTDRIESMLALVEKLRKSGQISDDEYIFMAGSHAVGIHEDRIFAGVYKDDVRELDARLRAIEHEEGLQADEYWQTGEGPPEWHELQRQWSVVIDARLDGVLRELGLDGLADLRQNDEAAFKAATERGRRSVHHKGDHRNAVASLVGQYESEAKRAQAGGTPYAAIVMYGAACEARLLLTALDRPDEAAKAISQLRSKDRPHGDAMRWTLDALIKVAAAAGWLRSIERPDVDMPTLEWAQMLKSSRNLLHPGRHALEHPHIDVGSTRVDDARSMYVMITAALTTSTSTPDVVA